MANQIKIDEINAQILKILLRDSRTSFTEIAKTCKISVGAVKMRYKHLWKAGIINGEIMQVNPYSLGYKCVGNIGINTSSENEEEVIEFLKKIRYRPPPVLLHTWGKSNVGLLVVNKNIEEWAAELRLLESNPFIKRVDPLIWINPTGMDHSENLEIKPLKLKEHDKIGQIHAEVNDEQTEIDETEQQIAKILVHNSRTSFRKIAKQLNISTKKVIQRYKKLRENVLTLSTITVDLKKLGYNGQALVFLKCERGKMSEITNKILEMKNIIVFYRTMGSYDLVAIAVLEDFSAFIKLKKEINAIAGIEETNYSIMEPFHSWPLNMFASLLD